MSRRDLLPTASSVFVKIGFNPSMSNPNEDAAQVAAAAAFRRFSIESWTLYSFGLLATILRVYARAKTAGIKGLRADDYSVMAGVAFYTIQASLAYSIGNLARGLANNGMTDNERAALSTNSPEYGFRVTGSQIQVAGWTIYSTLMSCLKFSMLFYYIRLTNNLGRRYRIRVYVGFAAVLATYLACIITVFSACRPFTKYWQISPDPGNACQAGISRPIIWVSFTSNVITDLYLILIPIPMLWRSTLKTVKKIASSFILGSGIFVLVCATLKSIFVLVDPINGAQLAGEWGTREAFVAVMTTNLPLLFPLFRSWLKPLFGSILGSTASSKSYQPSTGVRTIGGGGGTGRGKSRRGPPTANPITSNMTFNDSNERMVSDVKLKSLEACSEIRSNRTKPIPNIIVNNEVEPNQEDNHSEGGYRAREMC